MVVAPIVDVFNRKCTILLFLCGKQPPNHEISCHPSSALCDPHEYAWIQPSLYHKAPWWYPSNPFGIWSPLKYSSTRTTQPSVDASSMRSPSELRNSPRIHTSLKRLPRCFFRETRCKGNEDGDLCSLLPSTRCSLLRPDTERLIKNLPYTKGYCHNNCKNTDKWIKKEAAKTNIQDPPWTGL